MKKSVSVFIHFAFWSVILYLSAPFLTFRHWGLLKIESQNDIHYRILFPALLILPIIVSFYGSFFFAKLIIKKPIRILFPIALIGILLLFPFSLFQRIHQIPIEQYLIVYFCPIFIILFGLLGGLFQVQLAWHKNNKLRVELESQNHESKLALLRTQINPHFLFNTLHNIDMLISENQEKASKALIKLSDIMRYMLDDNNLQIVPLKKEIEHIENYLELEKLRLKNPLFITVNISREIDNVQVAPMLFIPFIENAFKHCVDSDTENGIKIEFLMIERRIQFKCENLYDNVYSDKDKTHGIGLDTVKKRLELLYPFKHKLNIAKTSNIFSVNLEIDLNDN